MRVLLLLRGIPGSGKSTFIKQQGLEPYVLCADDFRLRHASPVLDVQGKLCISQFFDNSVWPELQHLLQERMQRGCFTIIDATNIRGSDLSRYKKMAEEYKYRVYVLDFTDVSLEEAKRRNLLRPEYKQVPEYVIDNMYERLTDNKVPSGITVLKPENIASIWFKPKDLSAYRRIVHIGDIHGCYDALRKYFTKEPMTDDTYYIFVGDYIDRGSQNAQVMQFMLGLASRPNVTLLEGNHELALATYDTQKEAQRFRKTADELRRAGVTHKAAYVFYRQLAQCVYYTFKGKTVLVTHGGLSCLPPQLTLIATAEMIYGTGSYNDVLTVDTAFAANAAADVYQVHGHRNVGGLPLEVNEHCFNLDGAVEMGGALRVLELDVAGFKDISPDKPAQAVTKKAAKAACDTSVGALLQSLRSNSYIKEKPFGNISSFNFTRDAFYNKAWDSITCKARGLYIDTKRKVIAARSYDKFFNLNERPETTLAALQQNLQFPVQAYVKVNGFLGIVGYDAAGDRLIITSKGDWGGLYAQIFQETLLAELGDRVAVLKEYVKQNNCSVIFECLEPAVDPHIIAYDRPEVVLLEIIANSLDFKHKPYAEVQALAQQLGVQAKRLAFTLDNWQEFDSWLRQIMQPEYKYEGEYIEGFVIEDAKGFMTKLKLAYYTQWKHLRQLSQVVLKHGACKQKKTKQTNELEQEFYQWLQQEVFTKRRKDGTYPFATDIISLRRLFEQGR